MWCVRRVFSYLAGFDSVFFFFRVALQYATQLFLSRILQMTKYFVMRECEDIPTGISLSCDSALAHKREFPIFKFPERFSEISCKDLMISTISTILTMLIISKTQLSTSFELGDVLLRHSGNDPHSDSHTLLPLPSLLPPSPLPSLSPATLLPLPLSTLIAI